MARWMINCKEHSRLASQSMDRPLSFWDRLSVRMHLLICPPCNQLKKQFDAIRKACRMIPAETDETCGINQDTIAIPKDAIQKMKAALSEHLK